MNSSKVLVAHPDKQHSYRLATALKQNGLLNKYITTVYDKENSLTRRLTYILGGKNLKKAKSKSCDTLDDFDVVQYYEIINLIIIFLSKFPGLLNLCRNLRKKLSDYFGIRVAKYAIKNNIKYVIMYDATALSCFEYLNKYAPEIVRILDVSTVSHSFMKKTFDNAIKISGDITLKKEFSYLWDPIFLSRYDKEIELSNFFFVPSEIVKESLIYNNISVDRIFKIPYGVDISYFTPLYKKKDNVLRALFVGQVTYRKGINFILEAISKFNDDEVELLIAGGFNPESSWYIENKDNRNVKFLGFVTRDNINKLFQESDVFLLPSLAEGQALVGLEALASGLPVLCSKFSGVNDLIIDGYNGYVVDIKNSDDLFDKISVIKNLTPVDLILMKERARSSVEMYTWEKYYDRVTSTLLNEIINS
ncbi:glycosyltransferase [Spirosoma sp. HMF3257]|uniref:Glycosyl transferase family 1 domain-containing protein n=1 Tax=Spirosoma telluris TaxID=2183553 RepID=A0A327NIP4_9BACT|nr:glycosyltransferase [Spirosoma telluris]RAI74723.1 hypothetical protein HMF3257_11450 [Spirosoma telluris]